MLLIIPCISHLVSLLIDYSLSSPAYPCLFIPKCIWKVISIINNSPPLLNYCTKQTSTFLFGQPQQSWAKRERDFSLHPFKDDQKRQIGKQLAGIGEVTDFPNDNQTKTDISLIVDFLRILFISWRRAGKLEVTRLFSGAV